MDSRPHLPTDRSVFNDFRGRIAAATGARTATINLIDNTVNSVNKINLTGTGVAAAVVRFTAPTTQVASGSDITIAVTVTSAKTSAPTGTLTFSVDGKTAASAEIGAAGKASVTIAIPSAGTHHLVAKYAGDKEHSAAEATETITVK